MVLTLPVAAVLAAIYIHPLVAQWEFYLDVGGPFEFDMGASSYAYDVLPRQNKDVCEVFNSPTPNSFKFGGNTYSQITVCAYGYIIPGQNGVNETAPPMVNSSDFDSPQTPVIAAGLIENDRRDELHDLDCMLYRDLYVPIPNLGRTCTWAKSAAYQYYTFHTNHRRYLVNVYPSYGAGADNAGIVQQWIAEGRTNITYQSFLTRGGIYAYDLKSSLFGGPRDTAENFAYNVLNNVLMRRLSPNSDMTLLRSITGNGSFTPDWAYCFSWYKVGQPPEIIDQHNSYQLVVGCEAETVGDGSLASRCVVMWDFFEIDYFEQNGQVMRVGVTGPGITPVELPGSGNASEILRLVNETNCNMPGIWVYELNQNSSGDVIFQWPDCIQATLAPTAQHSMTFAPTTGPATTSGSVAGPATTAGILAQSVTEGGEACNHRTWRRKCYKSRNCNRRQRREDLQRKLLQPLQGPQQLFDLSQDKHYNYNERTALVQKEATSGSFKETSEFVNTFCFKIMTITMIFLLQNTTII